MDWQALGAGHVYNRLNFVDLDFVGLNDAKMICVLPVFLLKGLCFVVVVVVVVVVDVVVVVVVVVVAHLVLVFTQMIQSLIAIDWPTSNLCRL